MRPTRWKPLTALEGWSRPAGFRASGEVAKWLGNGLQNRYTRVRIPSSPPAGRVDGWRPGSIRRVVGATIAGAFREAPLPCPRPPLLGRAHARRVQAVVRGGRS